MTHIRYVRMWCNQKSLPFLTFYKGSASRQLTTFLMCGNHTQCCPDKMKAWSKIHKHDRRKENHGIKDYIQQKENLLVFINHQALPVSSYKLWESTLVYPLKPLKCYFVPKSTNKSVMDGNRVTLWSWFKKSCLSLSLCQSLPLPFLKWETNSEGQSTAHST